MGNLESAMLTMGNLESAMLTMGNLAQLCELILGSRVASHGSIWCIPCVPMS